MKVSMEHVNTVTNICDNIVNILNKCADEFCRNAIYNCKKSLLIGHMT